LKPLEDWTEADLEQFTKAGVQENSSVEYKASGALNFDSKRK
jgi:hypothetical protein